MLNDYKLPADVRIGHVHLKVSDLDRSISFYRDVLGFTLNVDGREFGLSAAFLAAGNYHHHIALNTFESAGSTPPPPGHTGLYHVAIVYPDRLRLVDAVKRVLASGATVDGGRDHGGTVSVYLRDPDHNGLELYYDRPRPSWFDAAGRFVVKNEPFEVATLIEENTRTLAVG